MQEKNKNKREWVKTVAIIFLTIMLILTFFSNTIMNYSLPEVAAVYVQPGTITAKIRGTGVVESVDPYVIDVKESRKISSVPVRIGDTVEAGDVLFYLADSESDELKEARELLDAAKEAYDEVLLSGEVTSGAISNFTQNTSTDSYRKQITSAQAEVAAAESKYNEQKKKVDEINKKINGLPVNTANTSNEEKNYNTAKQNFDSATYKESLAQNKLDELSAVYQNLEEKYQFEEENTVSGGDTSKLEQLDAMRIEAKAKVLQAQDELNSASAAAASASLIFEQAKLALENKQNSGDTSQTKINLESQKAVLEDELSALEEALKQKEQKVSDLVGDILKAKELKNAYEEIAKAQESVKELEEKSIGATIVTEVSGTIISLGELTAGKMTSPDAPVAVIQPTGKGFLYTFPVTNEQAKRLSKGDVADVVNSWRYDEIKVVLKNIKNDPSNPGKGKLLEFDVTGDVSDGQSLSVSVGQKSASYDLIVPNSAIKEDVNGKFVLIVESKSSPLGNRYIANRVDVEVLASDDTQSAISGALYGYEFVITTSSKPLEAGKQVRLTDN